MKKRLLITLLIIAMLVAVTSVGAVTLAAEDDLLAVGEGKDAIEGKRIIFIGQSYTYYGNVVEQTSSSDANCSQTARTKNDGYFYQVCKAAGVEKITITDWAYPSHTLEDLFVKCDVSVSGHTKGHDHLADLTDPSYDYVVIQESNEGYETAEEYYNLVKGIMDVFREANPDVKFIYVLHNAVYTTYPAAWRESVSMIEREGATIVDWGSLVVDVYTGATKVPGATLDYNKSSFIISQSASNKSNPNLLSGYLYSLMVYSTITGETPVGQSYGFAKAYTGKYSLASYTDSYYQYDDPTTADVDESETNMTAIFNSDADMRGLQTLAKQYLGMKNYEGYTITFKNDNGTVLSTGYYSVGDTVTPPVAPTKPSTENYSYTFVGWDKEVATTAVGDATYTAVYKKTLLKEWGTFAPGSTASELEGKRVFIAGCSYSYYGGIVEQNGVNTDLTNSGRKNDKGYLYKLFNANGASVTVTDWVFGGHDLTDIFDGSCASGDHDGYDHFADLTSLDYDYVILQEILVPGYDEAEDYYRNVAGIIDMFREANPDVKVFYTTHHMVYNNYSNEWRKHIQMVEDYGVTIIDWGSLVYDILAGNVTVPGAEYDYYYNSFVVSKDSSDGYHPTLLSGYINSLMTYCAITGETPIGQPLDFVYTSTGKFLGIDDFIEQHFKYDDPSTPDFDESVTNFKEILYSESDMLGLQTLASQYMSNKRWRAYVDYTVKFVNYDGSLITEATYKWGESVTIPATPTRPADGGVYYVFAGWDKAVEAVSGDATYTATYAVASTYTVTFLDWDGALLGKAEYALGAMPTEPGAPSREADKYYIYTFAGWDKTVEAVSGDATYTATYTAEDRLYTVKFVDYNGDVISSALYKLGATVVIPESPERAADERYAYTFSGWDKVIAYCSGDATYTATYVAVERLYTVTFLDWDGRVISSVQYPYGDIVIVPANPTRADEDGYSYSFVYWSPAVGICSGDATYTAIYNKSTDHIHVGDYPCSTECQFCGATMEAWYSHQDILGDGFCDFCSAEVPKDGDDNESPDTPDDTEQPDNSDTPDDNNGGVIIPDNSSPDNGDTEPANVALVAAISSGVTIAVILGGFSVFWFVIKKRKLSDLL